MFFVFACLSFVAADIMGMHGVQRAKKLSGVGNFKEFCIATLLKWRASAHFSLLVGSGSGPSIWVEPLFLLLTSGNCFAWAREENCACLFRQTNACLLLEDTLDTVVEEGLWDLQIQEA